MSASTSHSVQPLYGYERGLYAAFDYVDGKANYDKTVHRLSRLGGRALSVLGEVHLQEAANSPENAAQFLDLAHDAFSERIFSNELGFDPKAAIRFAQLPLHKSILADKSLPSSTDLADSYQAVLWAATTAANHFTYRDDQTSREGRELLGVISEATGLLVLTRYTLMNSLSDDWVPVQSLMAEDFRAGDYSRGWDISVHIPNDDNEPVIGHKVQIKNSLRHVKKYSRDIAVVAINPHLAVGGETRIQSIDILSDLQREASQFAPSRRATKRLNHRANNMLKAIDRAK